MLTVRWLGGPRCVRTRLTLSAALDGEASVPEIVAAAGHLGRCPRCRRDAAEMAAVARVVRATAAVGARGQESA